MSLADAREMRDDCRKLLAKGIDPSVQRKAMKAARADQAIDSFEVVAQEWLKKFVDPMAESHRKRVYARFANDVFPKIGKRPIAEITQKELLEVMLKIEERGAGDTAHRTLGSCSQVFRYAITTGRCEHNICNDLRGALAPVVERHFAAVTKPEEIVGILRAIDGYVGTFAVQCALRLALLVFVRPGELRNAKWRDFNLDESEWCLKLSKRREDRSSVPGADGCIIVPLSDQALDILQEINSVTGGGEYVFPGHNDKHRPMSENALLMALRRMGIPKEEMCGHGFRAAARTILRQELHSETEYIEHQLGHQVIDPNGRAYNRTTHSPERRLMMQAWADYLDRLKSGEKIKPANARRLTDIKLIQVAGYG